MKVALIGYGQMGHMIESIAGRNNVEIVERYEKDNPIKPSKEEAEKLKDVQVLIDFSFPEAVVNNAEICAKLSKNLVVGTTGWEKERQKVKKIVEQGEIGFVYASNFSLGINLFYKIAEYAGSLISTFDFYDSFIEESHHKKKKDAPSGTAKVLYELLKKSYNDKNIPVTSVRAGYITGIHKVSFDSSVDEIHLTHRAKNRQGFAEGALLASKWIEGRKGFYEFNQVLESILFKNGS